MTASPVDPVASEVTADAVAESARTAGELILRAAHELDRMFRAATAAERIEPFEARLLAAAKERVPQSELASRLGADASRVSTVTARLEQRGLLRRVVSRGDRRVRHAELTIAGRHAVERIGARLAASSPLVTQLDSDELRVLAGLLERVVAPPLH